VQVYAVGLLLMLAVAAPQQEDARAIERRIVTYVKENLQPGRPLVVSKLYIVKYYVNYQPREELEKEIERVIGR
jgi:hypothetical protein